MPAPGTLVLLRHSQSILNAQDRVSGRLDPPLTQAGEDTDGWTALTAASKAGFGPLLEITDEDPSMPYGPTRTLPNDANAK